MISRRPLISVIMNCYNSEKFLREAIESVYAQTYPNWEIIFWDNDSSDKSAEIANSFDQKLRYFKASEYSTLYTARNLALNCCAGEYIAFLDCDDIWVHDKLERQIALVLNGSRVVYGGYDTIDSDGNFISDETKHIVAGKITNSLFKRNAISMGCVLIERSILQTISFDPFYELLGDYDLWVRISFKHSFAIVDSVLEHSRQHGSNISITMKKKWLTERRYFYQKHINFINFLRYPWLSYYIFRTELYGLLDKR